ncbi:MAG: hypothetical protein WBN92_18970 [Terriglobia bacterium]
MNSDVQFNERRMLEVIAALDAKRRRRSIILTTLPLVAAVVLVTTASGVIYRLQAEQRRTAIERAALANQMDSLNSAMVNVGRQLTSVVEVVSGIEALVESKESYLRTIDEARFLIDVRMKFDSLHAALDAVSAAAPELPKVRPWRRWVTVVKSAHRLSELTAPSKLASCLETQESLATFRTPNGMLALALVGDGSFTTAYRQTVRVNEKGCVPGAYFADTQRWERVPSQ